MKNNLLLIWNVLFGLFLLTSVSQAARATTLILGKSKPDPKTGEVEVIVPPTSPATDEPPTANNNTIIVGNTTIKLTGNPQIDYIHDPNLPRELNGFNLTDYPFYVSIPEEIDFKCDGLHDGFYASVLHKCQVYHHCLFGTRYDFLCANYTAFDQKTFICHFASEVDCKNSPKYFKRNEALYKQLSTTTTTLPPPPTPSGGKRPGGGRRRRPSRRRKPTYDYYDDYGDYSDEDYEDSGSERKNKKPRPESDSNEGATDEDKLPTGPNKSLYERPRVAPKIRRPVPVNEREKYDYTGETRLLPPKESSDQSSTQEEEEKTDSRKQKGKSKTQDSESSSGKDRDSDRDRDRYRETERDRNRGRDSDKDDREEDYDRSRGRDRDRPRLRDEDRERDSERDRPREFEKERTRERRPAKKRRRPDPYASDYYDDYEDIRRPRPRDRPYDEEEDYEYDDRYYRKPLRPRDRIRERERDRPYRNRERDYESSKPSLKNQRHRDHDNDEIGKATEENTNKSREKPKGSRARDSEKYNDDEEEIRERPKQLGSTQKESSEQPSKKSQASIERNRKPVSKPLAKEEKEISKSAEGYYYDDDEDVNDEEGSSAERTMEDTKEVATDNKSRQSVQRSRVTTPRPSAEEQVKLEDKPVPAPRPAYITQPKVSKKQPEIPTRKVIGARRNPLRTSSEEPIYDDNPASREASFEVTTPTPKSTSQPSFRGQYERNRNRESPHPFTSRTSVRTSEAPPAEDVVPIRKQQELETTESEELAPRAPKQPTMSSKRRPFLPSRGGDPTLLRGLTSVGAKAFSVPKKEEESSRSIESMRLPTNSNSRERANNKANQNFESTKFPTGIEFRTRLTANLGVEQPKLAPGFQQDTSSDEADYSGEISDSREVSEDTPRLANIRPAVTYKQTDRTTVPLRPTLKTTDFSQLSVPDSKGAIDDNFRTVQKVSEESKERKYSSQVANGNYSPPTAFPIRQVAEPQQQQSRVQVPHQLGPQTFYSDNPKFRTAVTLVEPPRPTPTNVNYNPGTHIPNYYHPVLKTGQGQVQVVHLQKPLEYSNTPSRKVVAVKFPQPGNLEETDEYDVSFNDALQPISSLQPRNAQTGLVMGQRNNTPRRRYAVETGENNKKKVIGQRIAESNVQAHFAAPPLRPFQRQGDFFPIFS